MSSDRPSREEPSIRFPLDRFMSLPPDIKDEVIGETFESMAKSMDAFRLSFKREAKSTRRSLWLITCLLLLPVVTTLVMVGTYKERVDRMQHDIDRLRLRVEARP